ncbi:MAG: mechanosensitive ion channel family protein [Xanthomonadales bacterium]
MAQSVEVPAAAETPESAAQSLEALTLDVRIGDYLPDFLQPAWELFQQFPLALGLLIIILGYLLGKALQWLVTKSLQRLAAKTATDFDDRLIHLLSAPILQTTMTLSLILIVLIPDAPSAFNQISIRILVSLLLFFWSRAWLRATHMAMEAMGAQADRFQAFQPRTVPLFEMGLKLLMVGVSAYLFMAIWGIDGTAWLASAGVIGIAVGFAAKDTLANLISGVSIVADAPYKIGDYIVLDTGERGIVTNLGIRSTRLLTRDDVEVSIPNAVIGNAKITNESGGPWIKHRIRVAVGVAYGSNTEEVVAVLEQIGRDCPGINENPPPRVRMRAFGASSLDFELLGWINHPEMRGRVKHDLLMEIDRRFRQEGIVIPFPQRDVHIRSGTVDEDPGQP